MNKEFILSFLSMVSNKYLFLNAMAHLLIFGAIVALYLPVVKNRRAVFNWTVALLFLSVSVISIVNGNPFNSLTFGMLSVFAVIEIFKRRNEISTPSRSVKTVVCFIFILFGVFYPHFVHVSPALFIFLSPVGIIPCPTLFTTLGLLNMYHPKVNKGLYTITTLMGLFYGFTGVFQLKVSLDIPLLILAVYSLYNLRFLIRTNKTIQAQS